MSGIQTSPRFTCNKFLGLVRSQLLLSIFSSCPSEGWWRRKLNSSSEKGKFYSSYNRWEHFPIFTFIITQKLQVGNSVFPSALPSQQLWCAFGETQVVLKFNISGHWVNFSYFTIKNEAFLEFVLQKLQNIIPVLCVTQLLSVPLGSTVPVQLRLNPIRLLLLIAPL